MKEDYSYYWKHNVNITTSGNYNTRGLKYCIDEIGLDRCLYAIGKLLLLGCKRGDPNCMVRYTIRDSGGGTKLVEVGRSTRRAERSSSANERDQVIQAST